jgi:hypothetical protein
MPLLIRVVKKDTLIGVRGELMGNNGREVGIAGEPEDSKLCVRGSGAKEGKVG